MGSLTTHTRSLCHTLSAALILTTAACDTEQPEPQGEEAQVQRGRVVYENPVDDGNTFACATCHALSEPAADGLRRPGHPIGDALSRPHFKNGSVAAFEDAVRSCLTEWMNADAWADDDERMLELRAFLADQAPSGPTDPVTFQIVQPPPFEQLQGGDPQAGRSLFDRSCAVCHGEGATGTQRALALPGELDTTYVARRVRTSGKSTGSIYDGLTGGIMPFWAADRLSDDELRDIVAWLALPNDPQPQPDPDPDPEPDPDPDPTACDATHPLVGATAELVGNFHDVGGNAEVVDDCTIVIHDFTFDGQGIDVRLYGAIAGNFDQGFAIGEDLRRDTAYQAETLEFTLPAGKTLDDLDSLSIWCVPAGADFGSGFF